MSVEERLRAEKSTVAARVVDDMYEDPFWNERFAARGRKHSEQDLAFHVDYVLQALAADDPGIMARYAQWLQRVLVSRGMCTLHLADSFGRLGDVIDDPAVTPLIAAARGALMYPDGPARAIQERVRDKVLAGRPGPIEDDSYLVAYLADAVALGQPQIFTDHVKWLAAKHGRDALSAALAALEASVSAPANEIVAAART